MEDMVVDMDDERVIELDSIKAIFPEIIIDADNPFRATLVIDVSPAAPLQVAFKHPAELGPELINLLEIHDLYHLPPLALTIVLPEGYPAEKPPVFHVTCESPWISREKLEEQAQEGEKMWEEHGKDQIVYSFIDHLSQAAELGFGMNKSSGQALKLPADLQVPLLDFDLKTKREIFKKGTFDCGICLEPKKGTVCYRIHPCGHVFCIECLQDCFNKHISEGEVDLVKCLHPGCAKERAAMQAALGKRATEPTLTAGELLQIPLSAELVQRYVHLKRKRRLESDRNTVYCPRDWCQGAAKSKTHPKPENPMQDLEESVELDPNVAEAAASLNGGVLPMTQRLRVCEDCDYAFCLLCRKGWHGEHIPYKLCVPRDKEQLTEEEKATARYIELHSTSCPTCASRIQKTMGCNHMICFNCNTHFCYLCSAYLSSDNPYQHFNESYQPCYMRLWELEEGDEENAEPRAAPVWDVPPDDDDNDAGDEDDLEPQEPPARAPVQRAGPPPEVVIEFVHFAEDGAMNQRVERVARQQQQVPPPAPDPPLRGRRGRGGARGGGRGRGQGRNQVANAPRGRGRGGRVNLEPAAEPAVVDEPLADPDPPRIEDSDSDDTENEVPMEFHPRPVNARPAPGQGNHGQQNPPVLRQVGLQRFLQLAQQDQEDDWDSDELDDELGDEIDEDDYRLGNGRRRDGGRRMGHRIIPGMRGGQP